MRDDLKKLGKEKRYRFSGELVRFGIKRGWEGVEEETILLKQIRKLDTNEVVANHLWLNLTQGFCNAFAPFSIDEKEPEAGLILEFDARVDSYEKGWQGKKAEECGADERKEDWKLSRPTKIIVKKI